jgi:hypothetical protein
MTTPAITHTLNHCPPDEEPKSPLIIVFLPPVSLREYTLPA